MGKGKRKLFEIQVILISMPPLGIAQISSYLEKTPDWSLEDNGQYIMRLFEFPDFTAAVEFVDKIVPLANEEEHHPDVRIHDYNKVEVKLTTHSAGGLTEKDFKVAAKIDKL